MKNINVLIVEDEVLIAETIKLFLNERGHTVVGIAISYDEAIQKIQNTSPDVVLLDIRLSGTKSGIDVANYLRTANQKIPYIIVSSQYDNQFIEKAMQAGAIGYLTKPIAKESLWSTVELAVLKHKDDVSKEVFIELKISHGIQRIKVSEILYIKSDHVYVEINCESAKYLARYNLNDMIEMINLPHFLRCHRSYIINVKKIQKYSKQKVWIGDIEIPIGSKYKSEIESTIEQAAEKMV